MAAKLFFASETERRAVAWVSAQYGRTWRKRISETVSEAERTFPYPNLRGFCARPFGRQDWNVLLAHARNCLRRNRLMPDLARRLAQ